MRRIHFDGSICAVWRSSALLVFMTLQLGACSQPAEPASPGDLISPQSVASKAPDCVTVDDPATVSALLERPVHVQQQGSLSTRLVCNYVDPGGALVFRIAIDSGQTVPPAGPPGYASSTGVPLAPSYTILGYNTWQVEPHKIIVGMQHAVVTMDLPGIKEPHRMAAKFMLGIDDTLRGK